MAACRDKRESNQVRLVVVYHLVKTQQYVRADAMLQLLLTEEPYKQSPTLWRLASTLAGQRNLTARAVACLDRALELEFQNLPPVIHLKTVRSSYTRLLEQYQQVANAVALLESEPSKEFIAKVVRAADRWRALDPDAADVCRLTGKILITVGAHELAWDYLTTPIGLQPNEAAPWQQLAENLRGEGLFDLADKAYAVAFEAEPTNAQLLWDRAQNLFQAGRVDDALAVYRVLANGTWQPRFQGLQTEAKQRLKQ
jgi:tetratricopeptide (TPR) repeat protein